MHPAAAAALHLQAGDSISAASRRESLRSVQSVVGRGWSPRRRPYQARRPWWRQITSARRSVPAGAWRNFMMAGLGTPKPMAARAIHLSGSGLTSMTRGRPRLLRRQPVGIDRRKRWARGGLSLKRTVRAARSGDRQRNRVLCGGDGADAQRNEFAPPPPPMSPRGEKLRSNSFHSWYFAAGRKP